MSDVRLLERLKNKQIQLGANDERNDKYYEGSRRLEQIGLAVPPELEMLETSVNWCRTTVDAVSDRLLMRSFFMPGEDQASEELREGWDANNLDSESLVHHQETLIHGRGFVSVGSNADDPARPLIQVESAREMVAEVDPLRRRIKHAAKFFESDDDKYAVLYTPNSTVWYVQGTGGWQVIDRDDHRFGVVPIVMFLNRRRLGRWDGVSEMADVIPLVDAAARSLTNLQLAGETHSVPQKWVLGMSKSDFVDKNGNPIPAWEAYFNAIWANANKEAKVGQFSASDLSNFHNTVNHYAQLVSSVTGLPSRYLGQTSVNPAAEGAIRADESRLVLNVERKQRAFGDGWGWVMALYQLFKGNTEISGTGIKTEWYDAGTPTRAQMADAMSKLYANGQGAVSRETVWDELGWSDGRKKREWERLEKEARHDVFGMEKDTGDLM